MANKMMGYVICGYNSVDNLLSEQNSPFRRWTTGNGATNSYRQHDHRNIFYQHKKSEGLTPDASSGGVGARRGQWPIGGVARWSLGLEHLLADSVGRAAYTEFLAKEYAAENIKFWSSCEEYAQLEDPEEREKLAQLIWETHLADEAPDPVNLDAFARRSVQAGLKERPISQELFGQAQRQIFHVMRMDTYPRFLRSAEHAECARAHLRGLPPPEPYSQAASSSSSPVPSGTSRSTTPPTEKPGPSGLHLFGSVPATPSRVQKSASNASDRRRSGGSSILPWRRIPSRDRAAAKQPAAVTASVAGPHTSTSAVQTSATGTQLAVSAVSAPHSTVTASVVASTHPTAAATMAERAVASSQLSVSATQLAVSTDTTRLPTVTASLAVAATQPDAAAGRASNSQASAVAAGTAAFAPAVPATFEPAAPASYRGGSGGRANAFDFNVESSAHTSGSATAGAQLSDVVKTGPLCRVVLPDGATSVVAVQRDLQVQDIVFKLLQRRNLHKHTYDVLFRHGREDLLSAIDGTAPSTILGGHEVVVERRCVVRMDLGGRVVAVRCRPSRRLHHVLRPVLSRYSRALDAHGAVRATQVLRDGRPLHPDTTMLELDGARLQIVELSEGVVLEASQPRSLGPDGETDSLSEVALRTHDEDTVRDDELRLSHSCFEMAAGGRPSGIAGPSTGPTTACRPDVPPAGRVRAALKPGPPLHNHTSDFLQNLKDVQRQRRQANEEQPCASRTPPPLPPKPTLV